MVQVVHRCVNESCAVDGYPLWWTAMMVKEFGSLFYRDDDEAFCPHCGRVGALMDVLKKIKEDDYANHD